ncbi:MAG: indole-3-glycerol phosphate synthase TrpC [Armatimonadetes bacterium]|nr:indole-3-glycerol phosphate synthase TrpC [Armatimonadota bacterium]
MNHLEHILEAKRLEVQSAKAEVSFAAVERAALAVDAPRGFLRSLRAAADIGLIAEVKAASPSQGSIRADLDPVRVAQAYERAGAQCLSVLTDREFFKGSVENLVLARAATRLPVLRKDFMLERYQVYESRAMGADAILLILAALPDAELAALNQLARELGMDVLAEVHDAAELRRALNLGFDLIGVNNRNLSTFEVDLAVSETLIPGIGNAALAVSESALKTREDIDRVKAAGAGAVLIGTTFCSAPDIEAMVREVMAW